MAYVLPGLAFIKLDPHSVTSREKLPALGLVVFGVIFTIAGVLVLIPDLAGDCKSNIVLGYCQNETAEASETVTSRILTTMATGLTSPRRV